MLILGSPSEGLQTETIPISKGHLHVPSYWCQGTLSCKTCLLIAFNLLLSFSLLFPCSLLLLVSLPLPPPGFPKVTSKVKTSTLILVLEFLLGELRLWLTQNPKVCLTLKLC